MLKKSDFFKLGEIRKTHGVKGEMMLITEHFLDFEAIKDDFFFNIEECLIPFKIESYRDTSDKTMLFTCKGIDSIEKAAEYINTEVYLPLSNKSHTDEIENPSMLIGLEVMNDDTNDAIGNITNFIDSNFNPLLEITDQNGHDILLPFNEAFILGIEDNKLFVKIPEGLLSIDD